MSLKTTNGVILLLLMIISLYLRNPIHWNCDSSGMMIHQLNPKVIINFLPLPNNSVASIAISSSVLISYRTANNLLYQEPYQMHIKNFKRKFEVYLVECSICINLNPNLLKGTVKTSDLE